MIMIILGIIAVLAFLAVGICPVMWSSLRVTGRLFALF